MLLGRGVSILQGIPHTPSLQPHTQERSDDKYYWVIEGDIKGAFDNIHHEILLKLVASESCRPASFEINRTLLKSGGDARFLVSTY
jgi:retron-type reverse transcriptase